MAGPSIAERIRWAVETLDPAPSDRLLEIGCGHGVAVSLICRSLSTGTIVGIDRSKPMIAQAARRNREHVAEGWAAFEAVTLADADIVELIHAEQERTFMDESGLAEARPDARIRFSRPVGYVELLETVQLHGYHLMLDAQRTLPRADIAEDWYTTVYGPTIEAIHAEKLDEVCPEATDPDRFLWVWHRRRELIPRVRLPAARRGRAPSDRRARPRAARRAHAPSPYGRSERCRDPRALRLEALQPVDRATMQVIVEAPAPLDDDLVTGMGAPRGTGARTSGASRPLVERKEVARRVLAYDATRRA